MTWLRAGRDVSYSAARSRTGAVPGPRVLADKMALWTGRVSPLRRPTSPPARLADLGLAEVLAGA